MQEFVTLRRPDLPEAAYVARLGLEGWIRAAAATPPPAALPDVTLMAWGVRVPAAVLANRFRARGLAPPGRWADAARLAVLCHAVSHGLPVQEAARGRDARPYYRLCRAVAAPYYASARVVLDSARRLGPLWAAERWLAPPLLAAPAEAWTYRHLVSLVTVPSTKETSDVDRRAR